MAMPPELAAITRAHAGTLQPARRRLSGKARATTTCARTSPRSFGAIEGTPPFAILDFGCGPGRDLKTFADLGHAPVGLEGAAPFADMARAYSGCDVWHQDFLALDLPAERFDGVFANAALFHVPAQELPRVLRELRATLKPRGVLFSSNPRGNDDEGWHQGRYGVYHSLEAWRGYVSAAGFAEVAHYYRPEGLPRDQQPWLASVWRK